MTRRHRWSFPDVFAALLILAVSLASFAVYPGEPEVLPKPEANFQGRLGTLVTESTPGFPERVKPPQGAPNILLIMTDDEGFGASSTFGGPVPRPTLDRLAAEGLRYNRFHTTAICSPTPAALLTGRNQHAVRTGNVVDMATPFPGYWSNIPRSAASVARILRDNGYNTAMFGKEHNVPPWERSAAGPFERWPTGMGFEYFFGFVGGDADQWHPSLFRNTSRVIGDVLKGGETLDEAFARDAIQWIHNQKAAHSGKPFFVYYAPGTPHAPHQAPAHWIARFEGQFDQGWDRIREETFGRQKASGVIPADAILTPRPEQIPAWDTLSPDQQRVAARMMEVFAATVAYQDAQIGRIIGELERMGELENTLVLFITGDNGGSGEGGPRGNTNEIGEITNNVHDSDAWLLQSIDEMGGARTYQNYPVGWAWAMNTPFPWVKQVASHLGGTRNGLVVAWPEGITGGANRSHFAHVTDIVPTLLDVAGIAPPERVDGVTQQPFAGVSLRYSFEDADAPERHTTQYFESQANRASYHQGWWANTVPRRMPWQQKAPQGRADDYDWQLFNLNEDYSQHRDLAGQHPEKLRALQRLWMAEAKRNNVLPVDDRFGFERAKDLYFWMASGRSEFVYWGSGIQVESSAAPSFAGRAYTVSADVVIPGQTTTGVLVSLGSWFGGWSFYLKENRPVLHYAASTKPQDQFQIAADQPLRAGPVILTYEFAPDRPGFHQGGTVRILADGELIAEGPVARTIVRPAGLGETFDIGFDAGTPVSTEYQQQGHFAGEILKVEVQLGEFKR